MDLDQKNFREIDLFDFTSFFGLDFFKFSGPLWTGQNGLSSIDTKFASPKNLFVSDSAVDVGTFM